MFISIYNIDQIIKNLVDAAILIKHFNKYIIFTQVINEKKKRKLISIFNRKYKRIFD